MRQRVNEDNNGGAVKCQIYNARDIRDYLITPPHTLRVHCSESYAGAQL